MRILFERCDQLHGGAADKGIVEREAVPLRSPPSELDGGGQIAELAVRLRGQVEHSGILLAGSTQFDNSCTFRRVSFSSK